MKLAVESLIDSAKHSLRSVERLLSDDLKIDDANSCSVKFRPNVAEIKARFLDYYILSSATALLSELVFSNSVMSQRSDEFFVVTVCYNILSTVGYGGCGTKSGAVAHHFITNNDLSNQSLTVSRAKLNSNILKQVLRASNKFNDRPLDHEFFLIKTDEAIIVVDPYIDSVAKIEDYVKLQAALRMFINSGVSEQDMAKFFANKFYEELSSIPYKSKEEAATINDLVKNKINDLLENNHASKVIKRAISVLSTKLSGSDADKTKRELLESVVKIRSQIALEQMQVLKKNQPVFSIVSGGKSPTVFNILV